NNSTVATEGTEGNDERILIIALDIVGLMYGIQTLFQCFNMSLIRINQTFGFYLPNLFIMDYPALKMRGVAEDITRGQVLNLDSYKRYFEFLFRAKMNAYAIGYEQDFFKFKNFPIIKPYKEGLDANEVKILDNFAKKRFMELIPIYTSFGHQDNLLMDENYRDLGEFIGSQCYNISDPRIYDMLNCHYEELADCFSSNYFHMGCDESFDMGIFKSKKYIKEIGPDEALLKHYLRMYKKAKELGKKHIIIYHDIIAKYPSILNRTPKDLILMYWDYSPKKKFKTLNKLINFDLPIIVSPSHLNWCRHFPDYILSSQNIINLINQAKKIETQNVEKPIIIGQLNSTWGDFANPNLHENNIYGALLSAVISWINLNNEKIDNEKFAINLLESFVIHYLGVKNQGKVYSLAMLIWNVAKLIKYYRFPIAIVPPMFYTFLFRHPFYSLKPKSIIKNPKKMINSCEKMLEELKICYRPQKINARTNSIDSTNSTDSTDSTNSANSANSANSNTAIPQNDYSAEYFLDYIRFAINLCLCLAKKEIMKLQIAKITKKLIKLNHKNKKNIYQIQKENAIQIIEDFISFAEPLTKEYERLWLFTAKRPILDYNLDRFKKIIEFCKSKIQQIKNDQLFVNPFLKSEWISSNLIKDPPIHSYFRKTFILDDEPYNAKLLAIAGDYCKIFINGNLVGDVISRLSLSFVPIKERIKLFDVTKLLHKGKNVVAVESRCYMKVPSAINILIRIQSIKSDKSSETTQSAKKNTVATEIYSDSSWLVYNAVDLDNLDCKISPPPKEANILPKDWYSIDYQPNNEIWSNVISFGAPPNYNGHIYDDDILSNKIPFTEEYFGFESYNYGVIYSMFGKFIANLARKLFKFAKKMLKIE
ncbi:MAG: family 20 glycosylhydrolase, partial [Promethearchaeota archaeon]